VRLADSPYIFATTTQTAGIAGALKDVGVAAAAPSPNNKWSVRVSYAAAGPGSLRDGAQLKPSQAAAPPRVDVTGGQGLYTLIMVDPDAPSPDAPKARSWLHWLVVNATAPGEPGKAGGGGGGDVLCDYAGPTPPRGLHRYVFLVYPQARRLPASTKVTARARFHPATWAAANLGAGAAPAAAAYFVAAPE
jgi:phosphatidylethanolamine-binding protein (PEBP) family uncharacterized protein